jgi:hypothetical protein
VVRRALCAHIADARLYLRESLLHLAQGIAQLRHIVIAVRVASLACVLHAARVARAAESARDAFRD